MTTTPPADRFVSHAIDYGVTGTRRWPELSTEEQDQYILACFEGEAQRAASEQRLQLFDRVAGSLAQHLLGVYQQRDTEEGGAHYAPPTPRIAAGVLERRRRALAGTALGQRLDAALGRAEGKPVAGPEGTLKVYSVAPTAAGMEILDEQCSGDTGWMVPHGFKQWNNFEVLDRLHNQHASSKWKADQDEAFDRLMSEPSTQPQSTQAAAPTSPKPAAASSPPAPAAMFVPERSAVAIYVLAALACCILSAALLDSFPSWFYSLLRLVACGTFAWLAWRALVNELGSWNIGLGIAALVYNPVIPVHLGRAAWQPVNVLSVAAIVVFSVVLWRRERGNR